MLLAVGDNEQVGIVWMNELYTGLRVLHRPVTFVRYPNQGHGFTGAAQADWQRRMFGFFDSYLHPDSSARVRIPPGL